jgi:hypothetical protein
MKMSEIEKASQEVIERYDLAATKAWEEWRMAVNSGHKVQEAVKQLASKRADAELLAAVEALSALRGILNKKRVGA